MDSVLCCGIRKEGNVNRNGQSLKLKRPRWTRDDTELTFLALPAIIWFLIFSYLPMPGIILAFKNYKPIPGKNFFQALFQAPWAGLDNFEFLFKAPDAGLMIFNTLFYNIIGLLLGIILPVTMAIILSQLRSKKLMKVSQTMMFLPHFISMVVVNYFVFAFISYDKGYINRLIVDGGGERINFYATPQYWRFLLIFIGQWKGLGYGTVMYLAAITGVDQTFYEAAMIDGANKRQQIQHILLPHIRPMIIILFIMNVGNLFRSNFDLFYQIPRQAGALYEKYITIDVYVFNALMGGNVKLGSAAGFLQSIIGFVTLVAANAIVRKVDSESSLF